MRAKILTLLINTLDRQERANPTNAATRTGMEMAVVALSRILLHLPFINHRAELELRILQERNLNRERVQQLEGQVTNLRNDAENRSQQVEQQRQQIEGLKKQVGFLNEKISNQKATLRQLGEQNNIVSLNARLAASGIRPAPQQRRRT